MNSIILLLLLLALATVGYYLGRSRALRLAGGRIRDLHSLPSYYAMMTALWCAIPALAV
ncbi:MAG: phosphate ABC transporter permease family protein, partial [Gammaproteobacteria bacterium]